MCDCTMCVQYHSNRKREAKALSFAGAAYCAQILLTIDGAVKHAEEPDEGNLRVRFREGC
jgi:hypothetical protein